MAGLWYRTGSVAVTQSSKKITGTGTSWQTALNRPSKGNVFYGPDGKAYEIDYISSETELYLVDVYTGSNASSQSYKIDVRGGTVPELSRQLSEHYAYMQGIIDALQSIVSGSGDVTITGPSGQTVTVPALANMLSKSGNLAGLTDKAAARVNLGAYRQGDAAGANLNSIIDTGEYHIVGTEANWPWQGVGGHLYVHILAEGNYATQIAVSGSDGQIATRTMAPSGWSVWTEVMRKTGNQYMAGVLTNTAGMISIEGDRFTALRLLNAFTPANLRKKLFEFGDNGDLQIITRGMDDLNRGVITIPVGVDGQVFTSGNPPTANNVGAVPLFDPLESRHLNDIQAPGEYKVAGTQGGWPFSGSGGLLSVRVLANGAYIEQVARSSSTNDVKSRLLVSSVWRDWVRHWNETSLPTVSGTWNGYIVGCNPAATNCTYVRQGNIVHVRAYISFIGVTVPANDGRLRGLPFMPKALGAVPFTPCSLYRTNVSKQNLNAYVSGSGVDDSISMDADGGVGLGGISAPFESGAQYMFSCTYEIA